MARELRIAAALSHRGPLGRRLGDGTPRWDAYRSTWAPTGLTLRRCGCRRQRLPQAGQEISGSGPAVLRETEEGGKLTGWDVSGLHQPSGPVVGVMRLSNQAVFARKPDLRRRPLCRGGCAGGPAELQIEACPEPAEEVAGFELPGVRTR